MPEVQSKHGGANVRFPPPLVFLGCLGIGLLIGKFIAPIDVPLTTVPRFVAGGLAILAGIALAGWARGWFRRTGQDPKPWQPSPTLIVEGPYRFTRNPMYVGLTLVQVGIGVCAGSLWVSLLAPVALLLVHFISVRPEESYLSARFGEDYERYKASVRRYL